MVDSLDLKMPGYMVYCVVVACLGSFSNGWVIGSANIPGQVTHSCEYGISRVSSSSLPDCLPMSTSLWGFAVASFCIGGLLGGLFGGTIQTKFGRKKTIIFNNVGWIIGGILIAVSVSPAMFIIGRIFCGLSCGLGSLATPTYVGEISTIKARGAMGTGNQFFIVIGILLASVIGLPLAKVPLWRINYVIVALPAILQFFLMAGCVESPRYLISLNRIEEARASLQKLRPNSSIEREFHDMVKGQLGAATANAVCDGRSGIAIFGASNFDKNSFGSDMLEDTQSQDSDSEGLRESMNMIQIFRDPLIRKIAITVLTLHIMQQLIGMNAVMYYSTAIFKMAFNEDMSKYMAIVTTVVNFISTFISLFLIDRMGRRALLLIAETGACVFSVLLVIGYVYNLGALLVVSVFGYVLSFAIGVGPIPWMMTSELTPLYASSAVGAVATAMNWAMNFLIAQLFPIIFAGIHGYSFAIFAGIAALSVVYTWYRVPETKGRSLEQIVENFKSSS
ncbi:unnamed protein product [Mucor circinelloides]|uniref:Major facilitator superfamily (MFS) profile domain-containing protein n=1 Tax=Mucor circinelloides f. circinelloides (strain 1006PhL) TaxID=1220926 RepID=S2JPF7_MUCC1|nr:hypothetical protein HMPREF1544_01332 [Mucor circinelloides 1006PhL]KAG1127323.1 hypothetical protein G6F42_006999 [Rhizopus arrhizus]